MYIVHFPEENLRSNTQHTPNMLWRLQTLVRSCFSFNFLCFTKPKHLRPKLRLPRRGFKIFKLWLRLRNPKFVFGFLVSKLDKLTFFFDREALPKQGDNALGSVCPFVCLLACVSVIRAIDQGAYADNSADVVDRRLIHFQIMFACIFCLNSNKWQVNKSKKGYL